MPAGYSLARMTGRNGEALGIGIFLTYLVPPTLLFLPLSRVVAALGLAEFDVVAGAGLPDLHDPVLHLAADGVLQGAAARDRGGGDRRRLQPVRRLHQDGAPAVAAGILTVVIFTFTLTLQEFVYALTFISSSDQKPITLGVATDLIRGDIFYWGAIMAGALIASIPVAIAYNLFLDRFIAGITGGAVK